MGNPLKAATSIMEPHSTIKFTFYVIFQAIAVYVNLYYLIPKYLEKSRFAAYISLLLLTVTGASAMIVTGYYLAPFVTGKTMNEIFGHNNCLFFFFSNALPSTLASMTLAMSIKLTKNWIQANRRRQLLEKENLETELNFLKNQINPHFLFNTINSIFFLIHKNPDRASDSLAKFSELLRYQLYECNDKQIPLSKEIDHLENCIELEKLRLNENVAVSLSIEPPFAEHLSIAPFILMTFVENAFKHVSRHTGEANWINIRLHLRGQHLDFTVGNSTDHAAMPQMGAHGGIGLKNVQRRLDLIYPGRYSLNVRSGASAYEANLQLELAAAAQPALLQKIG
ncbi:sensor histidine kinase [Chitinophaga barathri]|uniref:Sensor histidine kinase n=2 Tax=Chitinophaga barathri TaxID=1647451 RepID=A0A3N4MJX7_9BACT|nr:sensor histidine kinase [Chitinophaga barathri]